MVRLEGFSHRKKTEFFGKSLTIIDILGFIEKFYLFLFFQTDVKPYLYHHMYCIIVTLYPISLSVIVALASIVHSSASLTFTATCKHCAFEMTAADGCGISVVSDSDIGSVRGGGGGPGCSSTYFMLLLIFSKCSSFFL